jgi:squalene-associated FAD-dependent desaturase
MRVAVVGGGWAGMAAAVAAAQAGHDVTVFEAARTLGGRARGVTTTLPDGRAVRLDNGQHILIGAYTDSLRLMRTVGIDPGAALLRLPLALTFPDGTGLALPDAPAPWDAVWGILRARSWTWRDKLALLRTATAWQLHGFTCAPDATVADLCAPLPRRLQDEFIEPLCLSALNTPASAASGTVFLRVLKDAMFGLRGGSNLLLPRVDLGALFPDAAAAWLARQGHAVQVGQRVQALRCAATQDTPHGWRVNDERFGRVILATAAPDAVKLAIDASADAPEPTARRLQAWATRAGALRHEAITTVYALADAGLPQPMLALRADARNPAQFVFDRGQLGGPAGLLAFVISASTGERDTLQAAVTAQALTQLQRVVQPIQTLTEKRATFACTPGLQRPGAELAPGLLAAGDYIDGPYPATLEGAVRSGWAAGTWG